MMAMRVGAMTALTVLRLESSSSPPAETQSKPGYMIARCFGDMRWWSEPAMRIAGT